MNLVRFLLIDSFIVILILLIFKFNGNKFPFLLNSNDSNIIDETCIKIPDLEKILELENLAKKKGSGISFDQLIGFWKFVSVWEKGTDKEAQLPSSLLRLFSASLELRERETNKGFLQFDILNSIEFGILSIRFKGCGEIKGPQPLLPFYFEEIQLNIGEKRLLTKTLETPDAKESPFFALIGIGDNCEWLAARGRGGGLAVWLKA